MDKKKWKKVIAREWLFLLGFVGGSGLMAYVTYIAIYPEQALDPGRKPGTTVLATDSDSQSAAGFLVPFDSVLASKLVDCGYPGLGRAVVGQGTMSEQQKNLGLTDYDKYLLYRWAAVYLARGKSAAIRVLRKETSVNEYQLHVISEWFQRVEEGKLTSSNVPPTIAFAQYRLDRWERDYQRFRDYPKRKTLAEIFIVGFLVLPYPLFVFIRTIIWSVKQVRAK